MASVSLLTSLEGCDLNDDGKPTNVFGKLPMYDDGQTEAQLAGTAQSGVGLLFDPCTDGEVSSCKSTLDWLPVRVNAATQLPVTVGSGAWQSTVPEPDCPAKTRVVYNSSGSELPPALPSAPLVLPVYWRQAPGPVHLPVVRAFHTGFEAPSSLLVCGVVPYEGAEMAIHALPASAFAGFQDELAFRQFFFSFFSPDIDLNGDGAKDAISIALRLKLEPLSATDVVLEPTGYVAPVSPPGVP